MAIHFQISRWGGGVQFYFIAIFLKGNFVIFPEGMWVQRLPGIGYSLQLQ